MRVVLLPGMQCTEVLFRGVAERLGREFPGLPVESRAIRADGLDAAARDAVGLLGETGIILGHSLGATVAMAAARLYPERVAGLALVCANPRAPRASQREAWADLRSRLAAGEDPVREELVELLLAGQLWADPEDAERARTACREMMARTGRAGLDAQLRIQLERVDERPGLEGFAGPVLAVGGGGDALIAPEMLEEIAERAPQGELARLPGASHMLPLTDPERLGDALARWLARHPHVSPRTSPSTFPSTSPTPSPTASPNASLTTSPTTPAAAGRRAL